jgi:monofunctional biosynthetic peptidoglycan transglycosylase
MRAAGSAKLGLRRLLRRWLLRRLLPLALTIVLLSIALVFMLRWVNPPTSAFMVEARWQSWFDKDPRPWQLRQDWRDLAAISPQAAIAVVASEDQKFPTHSGFDLQQIRIALDEADRGGRARGASTISQQVAKNLFLWSGQNLLRKGLEAYFTVLIEALWPKQRILEVYLNYAQFGRGIYGVQAASKLFFHHDAATLQAAEAALLAAVLPNPLRLRVDAPSAYVRRRRDEIVAQMQALGGPAWLRGVLPQPAPAATGKRR